MNYLSGLELIRRDPDAPKKIATGAALLLAAFCTVHFTTFVFLGYLSALTQRTARGQEDLLPRMDVDFDYFIKLAGAGFRVFLVQLVWQFALMPFFFVGAGCIVGCGALGMNDGGIASALLMGVGSLVMVVCMIPFSLGMVCATIRARLSNDIRTGLQVGAAFRMAKAMWKEMLLGGLVLGLVSLGLTLAGTLACFIGVFFAAPVIMILGSNYSAHLYREYVARGGEAVSVAHLPEADPPGSSVGPRPQAF